MFFTVSYKDAVFHTVTFSVAKGINKVLYIQKKIEDTGAALCPWGFKMDPWTLFKNASWYNSTSFSLSGGLKNNLSENYTMIKFCPHLINSLWIITSLVSFNYILIAHLFLWLIGQWTNEQLLLNLINTIISVAFISLWWTWKLTILGLALGEASLEPSRTGSDIALE